MFDLPLHPLMAHFPIVLGIILPFAGLFFWWAIKRDILPGKFWAVVVAIALVYSLSAWVASEFGEEDEEKVEKVVSEEIIEEHEEAGERLTWIAGGLLLFSFAGLVFKKSDHARMALVVVSAAAIIPLAQAGHSGGELVYRYGASVAHLPAETKTAIQAGKMVMGEHEGEHENGEQDDD